MYSFLHKGHLTPCLLLFYVCLLGSYSLKAQVGIGVAAPEANAMLEVTSTTRGLLIPRLTTAQRTGPGSLETTLDAVVGGANRARIDGMMVYDLTLHQLFYYDEVASAWVLVSSGGAGANLTLSNITTTSIPAGANIQFAANNSNNIGTTTNGVSNIYLSGAAGSINRGIWVGSARALTLDVVNANIFSAGGSGTITGVGNNIIGFGAGIGASASANNNNLFGYNAGGSLSTGNNNVLVGTGAGGTLNTGTFNIAIGSGSSVAPAGASAVAIGSSANAGASGIAIGPSTLIVGTSSVGIGLAADVSGNNSVAVGPNSIVAGNNSVAIGNGAEAAGLNSVAIGQVSQANGTNSASLLAGTVTQAGAIAIGQTGTHRIGINTIAPVVTMDIQGQDGIRIPVGTTAQRPGTPANGMLRYNSTLSSFEGYTGAWGPLGGGGTGVNYNVAAAQNTAVTPANFLFNVQYGAVAASVAGARIDATTTTGNATGLTLNATAAGASNAIGLNVSASGGAFNYAALFNGGNVGIGTATPAYNLAVSGVLGFFDNTVAATNGANNDFNLGAFGFARITAPTAAFTITGIANPAQGKLYRIYNASGQSMTIANENAGSAAGNRIRTLTGADLVIANESVVTVQYAAGAGRWIVVNSQNAGAGSAFNPLSVASDIVPDASGTRSLGSLANAWRTLYIPSTTGPNDGIFNTSGDQLLAYSNARSSMQLADAGGGTSTGLRNFTAMKNAGQSLTFGSDNILIGNSAGGIVSSGQRNVMLGGSTGVTLISGNDNTLLGNQADVFGAAISGAVAIGAGTTATTSAVALGNNSVASGNNSIALGSNSSATALNSVAIGANVTAAQTNSIILGSPGARVGIGTSTPADFLDVSSDVVTKIRIRSYNAGPDAGLNIIGFQGTQLAPAALASGNNLGGIDFFGGVNGAGAIGSGAFIRATATEVFTASANGTRLSFGTTANGTTATNTRMTIDQNGQILTPFIHNNGGTGGPTAGAIASGTYSPTIGAISGGPGTVGGSQNTTSSFQWSRVGNVVTVTGYTQGNLTVGAPVSRGIFTVPIPFGGNFASFTNASGTATIYFVNTPSFPAGTTIGGTIQASAGSTNVQVIFAGLPVQSDGNVACYYSFQYIVN